MKVYDISPVLSEKIAVYPGDMAFSRTLSMEMTKGESCDVSYITTSVHVGAHTDAPSHYALSAETIEKRDLKYYLGLCQVIRVQKKELIHSMDIGEVRAPRVLFATGSFPNPNEWRDDFTALTPELIEYLASKKVELVGIDTPSIDPATAKDLKAHKVVAKNNMAILEGIVLNDVPEGLYQLIALPLPIANGDAAPVRAILLPESVNLREL